MSDETCLNCLQLVAEKQELRDKLADHRAVERQAYRQIDKFLTSGERSHLIVAQAILDPTGVNDA